MSREQISVQIAEDTHVSEARRASSRLVHDLQFDSVAEGQAAIIVSELARNVLLHAAGGEIVLQPGKQEHGNVWVNILALDKGPGIADISRALSAGYASAGTRETGLGAVSRLSSIFEVYSRPGEGVAVLARVVSGSNPTEAVQSTTASVCVPVAGETRCGDAWEHQDQAGRRLIMVADGLGHGPTASDAAHEALAAFRANLHKGPREIIEAAHVRLHKTRGAAVGVAEIDFERQVVRYAGVGNIAGVIVSNGKSRSMISHNGIVGHQCEHIQELAFPWEADAFLVMHSDGVNARWTLDGYPGLQCKSAALIAAVLYRDFKRGRDDATVVVSREARAA